MKELDGGKCQDNDAWGQTNNQNLIEILFQTSFLSVSQPIRFLQIVSPKIDIPWMFLNYLSVDLSFRVVI